MNNLLETANRTATFSIALALLIALIVQLAYGSRANSITWDEGHHLFDGYNIWKHADYGLNPEVPPLVKLTAATPLLRMRLFVPTLKGRDNQTEAFLDGQDFVFRNDTERILFRAQMASALFMLVLA